MRITVLTLFPDFFSSPLTSSIIKRAQDKNKVVIDIKNIRDAATDAYKTVDDHPYGGGAGMVLKVDILDRALQSIPIKHSTTSRKILLDPQGAPYNQHAAKRISTYDHVIFVCGHYEGIDERARSLVDEELSIGDYILTGGEPAALVVIDSIVRLIPGVLAKKEATIHESFEQNLLEYPQYTRPEEYNGEKVPQILLSGDHERIDKWRNEQAVLRTKTRRPDLLTEQKDSL